MAMLGEPYEYVAMLVDSATGMKIGEMPWSSIKWQRTERGISVASVFIAEGDGGIDCCQAFGGLRPWSQLLTIERNGATVWDGPVMGWSRAEIGFPPKAGVEIRAKDRFAISMKRLIHQDLDTVDPDAVFPVPKRISPEAAMYRLCNDAGIGNPAFDPYPLDVLQTLVPVYTVFEREYRVAGLGTVYDSINELVNTTTLFYTTILDKVYTDELAARGSLGGKVGDDSVIAAVAPSLLTDSQRPVLNEVTCMSVPAIEVNGEDMVTSAFSGGASQGANGFPLIENSTFWSGQYVSGTLEMGFSDQRAETLADLRASALIKATENATPTFTIENVILSPYFGSDAMKADLSNLLPGTWVDIDFDEETCAFNVPFLEVRYEPRFGHVIIDEYGVEHLPWQDAPGRFLTPVGALPITMAKIVQIDVAVERQTDGGLSEAVSAALKPTAEWNLVLPTGWYDPTVEAVP